MAALAATPAGGGVGLASVLGADSLSRVFSNTNILLDTLLYFYSITPVVILLEE